MNRLFRSIALPVAALLFAGLIWLYATLNRHYETVITLPVRLTGLNPSLLPSAPWRDRVQVAVRATGRQLLMLRFADAALIVNVDRALRGPNAFPLSEGNVEIQGASGVKILRVREPSSLFIHFDAAVRKEVPVSADLNVVLRQDRIVTRGPELLPARIELRGPRCNVATVESLKTGRIEVRKVDRDTAVILPVLAPGAYGIELRPPQVTARIRVEPLVRRTFSGIPVRLVGLPAGSRQALDTAAVSLMVAGAKREVEALRPEQINVYVRYARFQIESLEEIEPSVSIPGNLQWSNLRPHVVRLRKSQEDKKQ